MDRRADSVEMHMQPSVHEPIEEAVEEFEQLDNLGQGDDGDDDDDDDYEAQNQGELATTGQPQLKRLNNRSRTFTSATIMKNSNGHARSSAATRITNDQIRVNSSNQTRGNNIVRSGQSSSANISYGDQSEIKPRLETVEGHHKRHHLHHHHAPSCLASKPVNEMSPVRLRQQQHQPHCIHHKLNCSTTNNQQRKHGPVAPSRHHPHHLQHHHDQLQQEQPLKAGLMIDESTAIPIESTDLHPDSSKRAPANGAASKQVTYLKAPDSKSYLLVEYNQRNQATGNSGNNNFRQRHHLNPIHIHHWAHHDDGLRQYLGARISGPPSWANNEKRKTPAAGRTTMRFVSQLYFLLHLSAIISLLLHHKNLVLSERKLAQSIRQNSSSAMSNGLHQAQQRGQGLGAALAAEAPPPQLHNEQGQRQPAPKRIRSIWSAPATANQLAGANPDILVRLVGPLHAKCALQYFLCYLLSSSVAVLVFLWLLRLCPAIELGKGAGRRAPDASAPCPGPEAGRRAAHHQGPGARQDCTPVLIGSISLGLIQLIVVGLDIANHVDWLSSGDNGCQWPIYLPFLQFVFVSLLMQYVLTRVSGLCPSSFAELAHLAKLAGD